MTSIDKMGGASVAAEGQEDCSRLSALSPDH